MTVEVEIAKTGKQFEAGSQLFQAYAKYLGLDLEFQEKRGRNLFNFDLNSNKESFF